MHIFPVRNYELKTKKTPKELNEILLNVKFSINEVGWILDITYPFETKVNKNDNTFCIYFSYWKNLFKPRFLTTVPNITGNFQVEYNNMTIIKLTATMPNYLKLSYLYTIFLLLFMLVYENYSVYTSQKDYRMFIIFLTMVVIHYIYDIYVFYKETIKIVDKLKDLLSATECENSVKNKQ